MNQSNNNLKICSSNGDVQTHHHSHHHHHHHHHHHIHESSMSRTFRIAIFINIAFVVVEFLVGYFKNSMGLLSDAGHNLTDVLSLVLAMVAFRLSKHQTNEYFTYGYKKTTIVVSLFNALVLLVAIGLIIYECVENMMNPTDVDGPIIMKVATIGVVVNGITAWLFVKDKDKDLNVKGAYLHMLADTLVSGGVVVSGVIIAETNFYWIDPVIGLIVSVVIIISTWRLFRDSFTLLIDGVPETVDVHVVKKILSRSPEVLDFHHVHVWALSTTENALTAHIVVANFDNLEKIKAELKMALRNNGVTHSTLEFELPSSECRSISC